MGPAFGRIAAAVEAVSHAKAPSAFSLPFPEAVVSVKQCFVHCSIPLVPSYHHPQQGYATPKILQPTLPVQLNFVQPTWRSTSFGSGLPHVDFSCRWLMTRATISHISHTYYRCTWDMRAASWENNPPVRTPSIPR
ncbi:hypothetical protein V2G26_013773 [Clonostachys chloroleuca]